jgi:imidazolonepropionase-like amidohydrolase
MELMRSGRVACLTLVAACAAAAAPRGASGPAVIRGRLDGAEVELRIADGRVVSVVPSHGAPSGAWLVPGVIDAHVHLAFWPVATDVARHGVAAAVDLAAPVRALDDLRAAPLRVVYAGPMLTRPGGYPLDAWGSDGYGIGCADAAAVRAAIDDLARRGARVIKLAIGDDGLDPSLVPVAVAAAHAHHLIVAAHALADRDARLAADGGVDVLAHTPTERLADDTVAAWRGRAVISTLAAFDAGDAAIDNLRRLRAAGVTVVYGTDLGNERDAGPSAPELELLAKAGLDGAAIVDAMTAAPARVFGLDHLGALAPGAEASFLVLDEDPAAHPLAIAHPREVWLRGRHVGP